VRWIAAALLVLAIGCDRDVQDVSSRRAPVEPKRPPRAVETPVQTGVLPRQRPPKFTFRYPSRPDRNAPERNPAVPAKRIHSVAPVLTEAQKKSRVSGIVILELVIETDGRVSGGRVLKPLPLGLNDAAIEAVRQWRYEPARDGNGDAMRSVQNAVVNIRAER
jgi:TonB family protein